MGVILTLADAQLGSEHLDLSLVKEFINFWWQLPMYGRRRFCSRRTDMEYLEGMPSPTSDASFPYSLCCLRTQLWICEQCSLTLKQLPWDWEITLSIWCKLDVRGKEQADGRENAQWGVSSEAQIGQGGWGRMEPLDLQSLGFWLLQATGSTSAMSVE